MPYLTIEIPVRLWLRVDGCVDNSTAIDVVDGVMETVIAGSCVRDAGWRASAIPQCIAVRLTDEPDAPWTSIADLTSTEGRIIPSWMATAAVKRGMKDERMEVIEILYGAAALSGTPPVRAVQVELDIPHRTASDWIKKARDAGRLAGMTYNVGRQADG